MGTEKGKQTPSVKKDFENLVPYKDVAEVMVEALEDNVLKEEFARIWPSVAQIENHPAKEENFEPDVLEEFPTNLGRVREILWTLCRVSPDVCPEDGRLTKPQRSFGNKLFAEIIEGRENVLTELSKPWTDLPMDEKSASINANVRHRSYKDEFGCDFE